MKNEIEIDPQFRSWLPLTAEEKAGLEKSLRLEGCRDAMTVWADGARRVLIDGHNRFEICARLGIEFRTVEREFESREAVLNWIIDNQLSKRNLTAEQRQYLIGKKYLQEKKPHGGARQASGHSDHLKKTEDRIAEQEKVGARTVRRAAGFARAVDTIKRAVGEGAAATILSGQSKVKQKDVPALARTAEKKPEEVRQAIAGERAVSRVLGTTKPFQPPRPAPEIPKGRQVSQRELRQIIRDAGACALTSTSDMTDRNAHALIGQQIQASSARVVAQAIAILIEEWPADGASFFVATVNALKSKNGGNSNGRSSGATPLADKYAGRG